MPPVLTDIELLTEENERLRSVIRLLAASRVGDEEPGLKDRGVTVCPEVGDEIQGELVGVGVDREECAGGAVATGLCLDETNVGSDGGGESQGEDEQGGEDEGEDEEGEEGEEEGEEGAVPMAIWDERDSVYRCVDRHCWGEIDGEACHQCGMEHDIGSDEDESIYDDIRATGNQAFSDDRATVARGTTPLLDLPKEGVIIPLSYADGRAQEYLELIKRGATRLMCEEFSLEWTSEGGIWAWVNQALMDELGGHAMEGCTWKVYLGRRIQLDAEDVDGSVFVEGILEDGVLFSGKRRAAWVTVKDPEDDEVWVTRPNPDIENPTELGLRALRGSMYPQVESYYRELSDGEYGESNFSDSDDEISAENVGEGSEEPKPVEPAPLIPLEDEYESDCSYYSDLEGMDPEISELVIPTAMREGDLSWEWESDAVESSESDSAVEFSDYF
ncbi:hypothetical protein D9611_000422 [Ephemerocybe angulata]|uniref:DUF8191 domain-containing protein n=1 Tax=Ephemerocybe angulata TaxID=980116 RepID=A0A8H5BP13_9AGAR|nr:hypothetical protein D9611_000422 [Tulosesus angulatus]